MTYMLDPMAQFGAEDAVVQVRFRHEDLVPVLKPFRLSGTSTPATPPNGWQIINWTEIRLGKKDEVTVTLPFDIIRVSERFEVVFTVHPEVLSAFPLLTGTPHIVGAGPKGSTPRVKIRNHGIRQMTIHAHWPLFRMYLVPVVPCAVQVLSSRRQVYPAGAESDYDDAEYEGFTQVADRPAPRQATARQGHQAQPRLPRPSPPPTPVNAAPAVTVRQPVTAPYDFTTAMTIAPSCWADVMTSVTLTRASPPRTPPRNAVTTAPKTTAATATAAAAASTAVTPQPATTTATSAAVTAVVTATSTAPSVVAPAASQADALMAALLARVEGLINDRLGVSPPCRSEEKPPGA